MNVEFVRTFLAIVHSGNFNRAAERLHVTQSTVTTRIRALEEDLGQRLFIRNKVRTELTAAGRLFQRYAETLVRTWEQARQVIALPAEFRGLLAIGAQQTLWEFLLDAWLARLRAELPDVALRAEAGDARELVRQLWEGLLDVVVTYHPETRSGLSIEHLFDDRLILVAHQPRQLVRWDPRYVFVDWGPEFREAHNRAYPVDDTPAITFGSGSLALRYLLASGGSGYLPVRMAQGFVEAKRLFPVAEAPEFRAPVYVAHAADARAEGLPEALESLRSLAREMSA